jgi:hypothetical protein
MFFYYIIFEIKKKMLNNIYMILRRLRVSMHTILRRPWPPLSGPVACQHPSIMCQNLVGFGRR